MFETMVKSPGKNADNVILSCGLFLTYRGEK
jgi:hypothetical protein